MTGLPARVTLELAGNSSLLTLGEVVGGRRRLAERLLSIPQLELEAMISMQNAMTLQVSLADQEHRKLYINLYINIVYHDIMSSVG